MLAQIKVRGLKLLLAVSVDAADVLRSLLVKLGNSCDICSSANEVCDCANTHTHTHTLSLSLSLSLSQVRLKIIRNARIQKYVNIRHAWFINY